MAKDNTTVAPDVQDATTDTQDTTTAKVEDQTVSNADTQKPENTATQPQGDTTPSAEDTAKSGTLAEPTEKTEKRQRIANDVFKHNTNCKVLYFTSDLIPFFLETDARYHGVNTLKNDVIVTINRK